MTFFNKTISEKKDLFKEHYFIEKKHITINLNDLNHITIIYDYFNLYPKHILYYMSKSEIEQICNCYISSKDFEKIKKLYVNNNISI